PGTCPLPNASVVDFVGYGANANCFEGSGPISGLTNGLAAFRKSNGCTDTDNNANDFSLATPSPRNANSPFTFCSPLRLVLEDPSPVANQLAAFDSALFTRDPFTVINGSNFFTPITDRNTRVLLFAESLQLAQGETASSVTVHLTDAVNQIFDVAAEDVRFVP